MNESSKSSILALLTISVWGTTTAAESTITLTHETATQMKFALQANNHGIQTYTREDILNSGESNVADCILHLPINVFGSLRPQPTSFAQGDAHGPLRDFAPGSQ